MERLPDDYPILIIVPGAVWLLVSCLLGYVITLKLGSNALFVITSAVVFVVGMAIYLQYFNLLERFFSKHRKERTDTSHGSSAIIKTLSKDYPEQLKGKNTLLFLAALSKEGFLDKDFRPLESCNKTEMAFIVDSIASICNISNQWKTFEEYWHLTNLRQLLGAKNQRGSRLDREETIIDVFKSVAERNPAIKDTKSYARWLRSVQE